MKTQDPTPSPTPNSVASAVKVLQMFREGRPLTVQDSALGPDDGAAVIAAMLLACAQQLERIADALAPEEVQP